MTEKILYVFRHVGGLLNGTVVEIYESEDGEQHMRARELHVDPAARGHGSLEPLPPDESYGTAPKT